LCTSFPTWTPSPTITQLPPYIPPEVSPEYTLPGPLPWTETPSP
jgi:hypothetical protein